MSLVPWSRRDIMPTPFRSFRDELDEFFGPLFEQLPDYTTRSFSPVVNVREDDKHVIVTADVPGVDKNDIDIQVDGRLLTLRGERKEETQERAGAGDGWWRRECSYGMFSRRVTLPSEVDSAKTTATLNNGILTIRMPKAAGAKSTSIKIQ